MQQKKVPMRKCIGCNENKPKKELVRVVKDPNGVISIDLTGKKSGRGAYICHDKNCLAKAQKTKRIEKAFQCFVPTEVYERLEEELANE